MYDGAMSRYWMNDVIMCHGSNCGGDTCQRHGGDGNRRKRTHEDERSQDVQPERREQRDDDVPED